VTINSIKRNGVWMWFEAASNVYSMGCDTNVKP
jgi:hypothetical protein